MSKTEGPVVYTLMPEPKTSGKRSRSAPKKERKTRDPKPKSPISLEQEDPEGRVDVLLARMLDHAVTQSQDFPLRALYSRFKPAIQHCLRQHLGPVDLSAFGVGGRQS